jgi:hypothetical protein
MNTQILYKLEKYRNKIKYEEKNDRKYLIKLNNYLNEYMNNYMNSVGEMSGGTIFNFETVDPMALINTGGIRILFGRYYPCNIQIGNRSQTKTVFEYITVPYGSSIPIYNYYYLDNFYNYDRYEDSNRNRIYLKHIKTRKQLPRVSAVTNTYNLKLYIYAYNHEIAIGNSDLNKEFKDQIERLRDNFDRKFSSQTQKRNIVRDAQRSNELNNDVPSVGDNVDIYDLFGTRVDTDDIDRPSNIFDTSDTSAANKFSDIRRYLERFLSEKLANVPKIK